MNILQRMIARLTGLEKLRQTAERLQYLEKRATLENPSIPLSDPRVWEKVFGGEASASGIRVDHDQAMRFSPVWKAVAMVSQDISCIPTFVYRRTAGDGKRRAPRHPAYRLLRRKANQLMTSQTWKQLTIAQAMLYGASYSYIVRDQFANPIELLPLSPADTYPIDLDGRMVYRTMAATKELFFDRLNVFHVPGVVLDGLRGANLIEYAKDSLGRGLAAEKYSSKFFANNAMPAGVLSHPHRLTDGAIAKLRQSINAIHGGLENQHRVAILEEGMTWTPLGVDAEKAQLIAALEFSVKEVARWFNIPPHRLGDDSKTSYNSVEQENLHYHESTLTPWFCKLREEAYEKLLSERQKRLDSHTIEELRVAILAADSMTRANYYSRGILDGWLSRDEVRRFENLNPIPDGEGEKFLVPLNMQVLGEEPPEDDADPDPPADDDDQNQDQDQDDQVNQDDRARTALLHGLEDATGRASKRLAHYADRAAKRPREFCGWLDGFRAEQEPIICAMYAPVARQAAALQVDVQPAAELAAALMDHWYRELDQVTREASAEQLTDQVTRTTHRLRDPWQMQSFARRQLSWNEDPALALSS